MDEEMNIFRCNKQFAATNDPTVGPLDTLWLLFKAVWLRPKV